MAVEARSLISAAWAVPARTRLVTTAMINFVLTVVLPMDICTAPSPPKADLCSALAKSALGQKQTHATQQTTSLSDYVVGARQQCRRYLKSERLRSFQIDDQLIFRRALHRQVSRFFALEDAIDIPRGLLDDIVQIRSVRDQAAVYGVIAIRINRRQFVASGETDDELATGPRAPWGYDNAAIARTCECRHGRLDFVGVAHVQRRELNIK